MTASPTTTEIKPQAPDLITLAECVLRYWWVAGACGVLFAVMGAAAGQLGIPAKFKATAMVRLSAPNGVVEQPNESSNAQREFRSTQLELMKMPHVLRRALESPAIVELGELGADPDSVEELGDWLDVQQPRSSEIVRIAIEHNRADLAFLLANAVADAYLQEAYRASTEELEKRVDTLDRLHADTENRLRKAWSDLQALAQHLGSGDPTALSLQAQAEIENYREYTRRLRELRSEKREAERLIRSFQDTPEMLSKEMPEDASMHSVRFAMFQAKLERERAIRQWGPKHPEVSSAEQEENLLREYYQKTATEEQEQPKSREEEMLAEPLATIARLSNEEQALEALIREIEDRMQLLGGDNAAKLEILRNEIARMERLSDRLWQTRENLQVERHADQRIQLVTYASLPTQRDTSKRNKLTIVLAGGGFGFAVFLVALGEFLTGRVHSLRDARKRTNLDILGILPKLPTAIGTVDDSQDGNRRVDAAMDLMIARLIHQPAVADARVLLVSSATAKAERTGLAAHLAAALARTGAPTLLLDLDLREADAGVAFPKSPAVNMDDLAELWDSPQAASGTAALGKKLETGVKNLDYLPAGPRQAEPLPVLTHDLLAELINEWRASYRYVVIETASVLEHPDALHLARFADLAVLAIQNKNSVGSKVNQAHDRLLEIGLSAFGMVLA